LVGRKGIVALGLALLFTCALADDLPIVGTYTQDQPCKGDGTDPAALIVKISLREITHGGGTCSIDGARREESKVILRVTCRFASGSILGSEILFTPRPDRTLKMVQQDGTYEAVLYKCTK
jgi:hypothetical protein